MDKPHSVIGKQLALAMVAVLILLLSSATFAQFGFLKGASEVQATGDDAVSLKVIDTYADMHTGPAQGYPIFYVVEQGEWIEILTRRPDWYEVRTLRGKVGWVTAAQIARTLQDTGEPADLPTVGYGDYLKNSWRVGMAGGSFVSGEFSGANTFNATLAYRPLSWMGIEAESGRFLGSELQGTITSLNVFFEPLSDWRWSPALMLGGGSTRIKEQPVIPIFGSNEYTHFQYGVRLNYYLGRNFVIRGEYRNLALSSDDVDQEDSATWNFGFSTFF